MSIYSIWQRNLALTPCGLVICKPRLVSSSCLGVPCLEGKCKAMLTTQNKFSYMYIYSMDKVYFAFHRAMATYTVFVQWKTCGFWILFCLQVCRSLWGTNRLVSIMLFNCCFLSATGHSRPSCHAVHPQNSHSLYACPAW